MNGILLDPVTLDLPDGDGGFKTGDTDRQNIALNLLSQQGDAKDYPLLGVGVWDFLNSDDEIGLVSSGRVSLTKDGAKVKKLEYRSGKLLVDAGY